MSWFRDWNRGKTLAVALFVSLAVNLFLAGAMVGRWGWHGDGFGHRDRHWGPKVWLTEAVGEEAAPRITAMWEAHRAAIDPLRDASRAARDAVHQSLVAEPFDQAAYAGALAESLDRSMAVRAAHHAFMVELAAALTPEQRARMAEFAGRKRWRHKSSRD